MNLGFPILTPKQSQVDKWVIVPVWSLQEEWRTHVLLFKCVPPKCQRAGSERAKASCVDLGICVYIYIYMMTLTTEVRNIEAARLCCGHVHVLFLLIPACRTHCGSLTV